MRQISLLLVFSALLLAPAAASAQSRQELDARLRAVEAHIRAEQSQGGDASTVRIMQQLDVMERQIQDLTARVEELGYQNRQLRDDYETLQQDMMSMIGSGSSSGSGGDYDSAGENGEGDSGGGDFGDDGAEPVDLGGSGGNGDYAIVDPDDPNAEAKRDATRPLGGSPVDPGSDPDILFARGQTRLMEGDYPAARNAFEGFVDEAEGDERVGEAWFWIGRTSFIEGESAAAADAYIQSMQAGGPKAPDAMVQLGVALAELGETQDACDTLNAVPDQFPDARDSVLEAAERELENAGCG